MAEPVTGRARTRAPVHLWIVGGLALFWNGFGLFDYVATLLRLDFYMEQFTEDQLEYFYGFPDWMMAVWALGVGGGVLGSVGLLMRRRWAVWMFAISLVGMAISTFYSFVFTDGSEVMGQAAVVMTVVIWTVAIALLLYSMRMAKRGVLV